MYQIAIENNVEGRSLAWVMEHPGCFAYADHADAALVAIPAAISNYAEWIASRNGGQTWVDPSQIELYLGESWDVYWIDENFDHAEQGYEVNAWFQFDWKPLTEQDLGRALSLLSWSRDDLLDVVRGLSPGALAVKKATERWSIAGILRHVAVAEWWYMDRLGLAFPKEQLPEDPFERLEIVRGRLLEVLPSLVGSKDVVGVDGEFWSARKMLRRAVWHERDHSIHIHKLR